MFREHPGDCLQLRLFAGRGVARFGPFPVESGCLELAYFGGDAFVPGSLAHLALQLRKLAFELAHHIFDALQVALGRFELELRFMTAGMQAGDAGGFFENSPPRLRFRIDQLADLPLAHQGRRSRPR